jgi:uncharacterized protein YdcH (DUF465 family)
MDNHDLHHEFPQFEERIHELKISDNHFRKLFDEYHQINKDIHRLEVNGVYTDLELNEMRSKRIHLKDELFKMIAN